MSNAVSSRIAAEYQSRFGLKIPEWRLMAVLGEGRPLTQRELVALHQNAVMQPRRLFGVKHRAGAAGRTHVAPVEGAQAGDGGCDIGFSRQLRGNTISLRH